MSDVKREPLAFMGTPGFVRDPERFNIQDMLSVLGANSGNLMFQRAAALLLGGEHIHVGRSETPYNEAKGLGRAKYLVVPAANHLRLGADWTGFSNYLARAKPPLLVLGLGAQSPKLGGETATVEALKADPQVSRLAAIIRDKAAFVSVRGPYSRDVCEAFGIHDVAVMGCPSALLNPDPSAGAKIAAKLAALKASDEVPLFGLTAAAPFEIQRDTHKRELEQKLFAFLYERGGLFIQQSGGPETILAAGPDHLSASASARRVIKSVLAPELPDDAFWDFMARRGRFYVSVREWLKEVAHLDLMLGTRLHGNMAAIAAGTPGVVIAHDSRTGELTDTMHLPALTMDDVMGAGTARDLVEAIRFDGAAFDAWRQRTATTLRDKMIALGVPVSAHLERLANAEGPARDAATAGLDAYVASIQE